MTGKEICSEIAGWDMGKRSRKRCNASVTVECARPSGSAVGIFNKWEKVGAKASRKW